jgi:hypothetical protein
MATNNDDLVQKLYGMTHKDLFFRELEHFKSITCKMLKTDDDSKGIYLNLRVASLEEACFKASLFLAKLRKYGRFTNETSHMSLYYDGLVIILYGSSINALTDDDWGMARELVNTLRSKE